MGIKIWVQRDKNHNNASEMASINFNSSLNWLSPFENFRYPDTKPGRCSLPMLSRRFGEAPSLETYCFRPSLGVCVPMCAYLRVTCVISLRPLAPCEGELSSFWLGLMEFRCVHAGMRRPMLVLDAGKGEGVLLCDHMTFWHD